MEYDMNGYVTVRLNDYGKAICDKNNIKYNKNGTLTMQLWLLMKTFGKYMPEINPFDNMFIQLDNEYLHKEDIKKK